MTHTTLEACFIKMSVVKKYEKSRVFFTKYFHTNSFWKMCWYEITGKPCKKCIKSCTIGDCKVTGYGSPVSHRLEWRLMKLPSWPGNVRICHYCHLEGASVTPLIKVCWPLTDFICGTLVTNRQWPLSYQSR